jgi:hypothetical protein
MSPMNLRQRFYLVEVLTGLGLTAAHFFRNMARHTGRAFGRACARCTAWCGARTARPGVWRA